MQSDNLYFERNQNESQISDDKELHTLSMNQGNKVLIYNKWAKTYDKYVEEEHYYGPQNLVSVIMRHIPSRPDTKVSVLDFGCGTGLVGKEINAAFKKENIDYNLTGIDISPGMITESEKLGVYNNLLCKDIVDKDLKLADVKKITSSKDGFDLILSCGVFLEGHVSLDAIPSVLLHLLSSSGGILAVTIRDTFLKKSPDFKSELTQLESDGYKLISLSEIEYLREVKAWLLIVSFNK